MPWNLQSDRPIYQQLVEIIELRILSGYYKAGDRLPSVRELASDAGVTPNTMQKAFAELEQLGLVYTQRTAGRTVTDNQEQLRNIRTALARQEVRTFLFKMKDLGFEAEEIRSIMEQLMKEDRK